MRAFPLVLTAGIALIPGVVDYADQAQAARAAEQSARRVGGHVVAAATLPNGSGPARDAGARRLRGRGMLDTACPPRTC